MSSSWRGGGAKRGRFQPRPFKGNREDGPPSSDRRSFSPSKRGFSPGRRGGSFPSRRGFRSSRRGFQGGRNRGNFNNNNNNNDDNNPSFGRGGAHHHDGNFVPRGRGRGSPRSRGPFRGSPRSRGPFRGGPRSRGPFRGGPAANRLPRKPKSGEGKSVSRGVRLNNEAPFHHALTQLKQLESFEEKAELAKNILAEQYDGYEVNVVLTTIGSEVFLTLLRGVSLDIFSPVLSKIVNAAGFLCSNFIGGKMLAKLLKLLGEKLEKCHTRLASGEVDESNLRIEIASCEDFISKIAAKVIEILGDMVFDPHVQIVLRVLLPMLVGKKAKIGIRVELEDWKFPIPTAFPKLLESSMRTLTELDLDGTSNPKAAGFLRMILHVLHSSGSDLIDRVIEKVFSSNSFAIEDSEAKELPAAFTDPKYTFFVKDMMNMMSPSLFQKTLETYQPLFAAMAAHPIAKCVLFDMLRATCEKKQVLTMFGELKPVLENVGKATFLELSAPLAEAWAKHGCKEQTLMKALKSAFGYKVDDDKSFVEFLLTTFFSGTPKPKAGHEIIGVKNLLKVLLQFTECREVITDFVALNPDLLVRASMDKRLCHVIVKLLKSSFATEAEKTALINNMMGKLAFVTCDRFGLSVVVEMWRCSNQLLRQSMAKEVAKEFESLITHGTGRVLCTILKLREFIKTPKKWMKQLEEEMENGTNDAADDKEAEVDSDDDDELLRGADDDDEESQDDKEEDEAVDDEADTSDDDDDSVEEELVDDEEAEEESVDGEESEDDDDDMEIEKIEKVTSMNANKRKMNPAPAKSPGPKSKKQKVGNKFN